VDGDFGPATQRAIKDFQTKSKIKPTGSVDQLTRNYLFAGFAQSQFLNSIGKSDTTKTTAAKADTTAVKAAAKSTAKTAPKAGASLSNTAKNIAKNQTGTDLVLNPNAA
jgi:peptidoglycan hydrolase-like protein with peptidoglycan-binding domain